MGFTETAFLGLKKPTFGATPLASQKPWGQEMNANLDAIDAALETVFATTTVDLTLGAATGSVALGVAFSVLAETCSHPGRFRLYRSAAGRDADLTRPRGGAVHNDVGLLLEDIFTAAKLTVCEEPAPGAPETGTDCYWSWDGALGAVLSLTVTGQIPATSLPQGARGGVGPGMVPGGAAGEIPIKASSANYDLDWFPASAYGLTLLDDADAGTARTTLGLGNSATRNVGTAAGTVAAGDDPRLSDARVASDVYAWAKAATKPIYTASEVGAAATNQTFYIGTTEVAINRASATLTLEGVNINGGTIGATTQNTGAFTTLSASGILTSTNTTPTTSSTTGAVLLSGGIGQTLTSTETTAAGNYGIYSDLIAAPSSASTRNHYAHRGEVTVDATTGGTYQTGVGGYFRSISKSPYSCFLLRGASGAAIADATCTGGGTSLFGVYGEANVAGSGTWTNVRALTTQLTVNTNGAATDAIGYYAMTTLTKGTVYRVAGVIVGDMSGIGLTSITGSMAGLVVLNINAASATPAPNAYALYTGSVTGATNNWQLYLGTGISKLNDTTDSTSTTSGSLQLLGGAGIAKNLYVGGDINGGGSLTFSRDVAGTNTSATFNNTDYTAGNQNVIRIRQSASAGSSHSAYLGVDTSGNVWLSSDTTVTKHLQISTTGAVTFSKSATFAGSSAGTNTSATFNNTDYTAGNQNVIRIRQATGASAGYSAYLGVDTSGNVWLSSDTTVTKHLQISTTGDVSLTGSLALASGKGVKVGGNKVLGDRGAAVADATDAATVITQLNALLARCRAHGIIAT